MMPLAMAGVLAGFTSIRAQTWMPTSAPSNVWSAVACSADGTHLVAATGSSTYNGQIYTSTNGGTNWSLTAAPTLHWVSVASSADGHKLLAAAYANGIYT